MYFFSRKFIWFWQKEPIKAQSFRLSTAHLIFCFKNDKNLVNFYQSIRNSQDFYFDWFSLWKVYNVWPKKVQCCLTWHWRMIKSLKENWIVVSKMTWRIWRIFTTALQSLKIGTFMGYFYPSKKIHELKIYRGVICQDISEWCKLWRRIDLLFQNWLRNLTNFDLSTQMS